MKVKLENSQLTMDVHDLADSLPQEELELFAQHVVFNEKLFEGVIDTLLQGCCWDGDWYIGEMDQRLRLRLLPMMPTVIRELVKGLVEQHAKYASAVKKHEDVLFKLLRSWPEKVDCPVEHSYVRPEYRYLTAGEADAYIAKELGDEWEAIKKRHAEHTPQPEPVECPA